MEMKWRMRLSVVVKSMIKLLLDSLTRLSSYALAEKLGLPKNIPGSQFIGSN
jgi:hypothetical protein